MLEKKEGNFRVDKLRAILLYGSKFQSEQEVRTRHDVHS
jgi:hypothetical protein